MTTDATAPRRGRWTAKRWLLVVALGLAGLITVLVGVALLSGENEECGCSIHPSPTASPDLRNT